MARLLSAVPRFLWLVVPALLAVAPQSNADGLTTIHGFTGSDGWVGGGGGLARGKGGVLVGTAGVGGLADRGTVFTLTPPAGTEKNWTFRTIHQFVGKNDGAVPTGGVAVDGAGNIYGFTQSGPYFYGGVYRLKPPASADGAWSESFAFEFDGVAVEANQAVGTPLFFGNALYAASSKGTIFRLVPPSGSGSKWGGTRVVKFAASEGVPTGALTLGAKGVLLVPTVMSDYTGSAIFALSPPANPNDAWTKTLIFRFRTMYSSVLGQLAVGADGAIYGVVSDAGTSGRGQFFKLTPPAKSGGAWTESASDAPFIAANGYASGGVVLGADNRLYSFTAYGDGAEPIVNPVGTILQVTPPAGATGPWGSQVEHSFTGGADGGTPFVLYRFDSSGDLYGLAQNGGLPGDVADNRQHGWGIAFQFKP